MAPRATLALHRAPCSPGQRRARLTRHTSGQLPRYRQCGSRHEPDLFPPNGSDAPDVSPEASRPQRRLIPSLAGLDRAGFVKSITPIIHRATLSSVSGLLLYQHAKRDLGNYPGYEEAIEAAMAEQRKTILARYQGSLAFAQAQLQETGTNLDEQLEQAKQKETVQKDRKRIGFKQAKSSEK